MVMLKIFGTTTPENGHRAAGARLGIAHHAWQVGGLVDGLAFKTSK
jgi:hypothetical protein